MFILLVCVQSVNAQWDPFGFGNYMQRSVVKNSYVSLPNFAIDTTQIPPTPYSGSWLYFAGAPATRGQFARLLASADGQYGVGLPASTTDSFTIAFSFYSNSDNHTILGKANWVVTRGGTPGANILGFAMSGGGGYVNIATLSDTAWHDVIIKYNKASTTLQCWFDGVRTVNNTSYPYTVASSSWALSVGTWYSYNSTADTSQQATDNNYMKGGLKAFSIQRYQGAVDTTYTYNFIGYGQHLYCTITSGGSYVNGWYDYDRADYTDALPLSPHMELGISPAPDTKDPVWVNPVGSVPSYLIRHGEIRMFDFTAQNNLVKEGYTNGETEYVYGDSTWVVVTGQINETNITSTRTYADSLLRIGKYNIVTGRWSSFKNSQYPDASIYGACQWDTSLIVVGAQTGFNGVARTKGIARWDGSNWVSLDSGFTSDGLRVRVYDDTLYAGGVFPNSGSTVLNGIGKIARNGEWRKFGTGTTGTVFDIIKYKNEIYIGGDFESANGVTCNGFAKWNGSTFVAYGRGVQQNTGSRGYLYCFAIYNDELYAGGEFDTINGIACSNLFKFDGTTFTAVGTSITRGQQGSSVIEMKVDETYNQLYIKGQFSRFNGKVASCGVVMNETGFVALPPDDMRPEGMVFTGNGTPDIRYFFMGDQESVYGLNVSYFYELVPPR